MHLTYKGAEVHDIELLERRVVHSGFATRPYKAK